MLYNSRTQAEYDALPADIKAEYKKTGEVYTLQHDEDVGAIKRARDREKQRADDVATDRDAIKTERDTLLAESKKTGTPAQIAAQAKVDALKEVQPQLDRAIRLETSLKTQAMETTAADIAKQIGGEKNKIALLPTVERRIEVTLGDDDKAKIVVKDAVGKPTTLTTADLVKEIKADKNYESLVQVEAGSGGVGRQGQEKFQPKQSPAGGAGEKPAFMSNKPEDRQQYIRDQILTRQTGTQQ